VYSIGPAGENLVKFAAIQGDYGHVASKNGVGAVMGKKKLKAVAIVKGTKSLRAADYRAVVQAADDIAHELKTDPSSKVALRVRHAARRGEPGPARRAAHQELHDQRHRRGHVAVGSPKLREARSSRAPVQRVRDAPLPHAGHSQRRFQGQVVDEPEYEGWSGAGWAIGATDQQGISWLNTQLDRACLDVTSSAGCAAG